MPPTAWVRPIPDRYADATRGVLGADPTPIDVALARHQHAAVVDGLRWLGFAVVTLPAAHALPDSVFVEDPAVIVGDRALIARSAHPVRALEAASVRDALTAGGLGIAETPDRATLDGGDVLLVGGRLFASPSSRTNLAGITALAAAFPDVSVTAIALPAGVLHLKCACSAPDADTVLYAEGSVDPSPFAGLRTVSVPREELYAANCVGRAHRVLIAAGFPGTARALTAAGFAVRALDLSEIRKGDGSITCLSLRMDRAPR